MISGPSSLKPTLENILFALPQGFQQALKSQPSDPFTSDYEYFSVLETSVLAKSLILNYKAGFGDRLFSPFSKVFAHIQENACSHELELENVLADIAMKIETQRQARLQASETANFSPRLERMYVKLNASPKEKMLFDICLAHSVVEISPFSRGKSDSWGLSKLNSLTGILLSKLANVPLPEIMDFASAQGKWAKNSLLNAIAHPRHNISVTENAALGLIGVCLSSTQFLSIESPLLQEVISNESGFEETNAGKGGLFVLKRSSSDKEKVKGEGDHADVENQPLRKKKLEFENIESLFTLIRQQEEKTVIEETPIVAMDIAPTSAALSSSPPSEEEPLLAYKSELDYIQDQTALMCIFTSICRLHRSLEDMSALDDNEFENMARFDNRNFGFDDEINDAFNRGGNLQKDQIVNKKKSNLVLLKQKERVLKAKIFSRLALCKSKGIWYPRLERLTEALELSSFEKNIILTLISTVVTPGMKKQSFGAGVQSKRKCRSCVSEILDSFCSNLEEQMTFRKYFYKSSVLVKEGIINMSGHDFMMDLTDCEVEIDRRMMDFVIGLDTEFSEIVDGSHLYAPNVNIDDVILPDDTKQLVEETVSNFDQLKRIQKEYEVDKKITYGRGMVLLFYGTSGTGKTMLANALATKLNKKVLLINFPTLGTNESGAIIKLIFREAKIHNAILFFDECESLFRSRDIGTSGIGNVNMVLTELERHDGLSIMATNRPNDLDEAMYRRITLAVEFRKPDHILREKIWESLRPPKLPLAEDVNLQELALKYELSGGFIKNTWLSALSFAVTRNGTAPVINQDDLRRAAAHQLRGRLNMIEFDRRIVPTRGLDDVVVSDALKSSLSDIVNFGKAQSILFGQWGFYKQHGESKGISALFCGPSGTGKTMCAEAIGYDLGRAIKVVNCAQLLSKWVGESSKNIQSVFDEAKAVDAILVFDEAEGIFGSRSNGGDGDSSRHDTMNVGILLHHMETFPGVIVVITNLKEKIDSAFFRRFKFVLDFTKPTAAERMKLWRLIVPAEAPLAGDVDFDYLARRFEFTGGNIKSAVFRAASRAALRVSHETRRISMEDIKKACEEEAEKSEAFKSVGMSSMYN